ncbi:uncharacterized protein ATNIH1004_009668 [Aspergillus tanneri]|nr:uncharacterized protein ATNIH1004_009668 [Aspergillus tanneri]KAA8642907.1 hypothetical protein ATNIH1004_009668 [Aspergillus tanneri]
MQRAAASAAVNDTPQPSTDDSNPPTPKRHRTDPHQSHSPATPSSDLEAISAALAAEEDRRREVVSRQAAEAGETEWVLDFGSDTQYAPQPQVITADSLDADDDDMVYGGRQAYGNFKRKKKTWIADNGGDEGEGDVDSMIEKAKSKVNPPPVRLSKLTSISGGRQAMIGGSKPQKKRKH